MAKIIDGKEIAKNTRGQIAAEVSSFIEKTGVTPGLAVIIVGRRSRVAGLRPE